MPGVVVSTATKAGAAGPQQNPSGQAFFVGLTERGSVTEPVLLRGMADVERELGDRPAFGALYDQLKVFFDEGGRQCYVARVVGDTATVGTLSLSDRATVAVPTLRVDAANPGAWSSRVKVEVRDGNATDTFRIIVTLDDEVVEDITNLGSPAEAVAKFAKSPYVRLTSLGSATVAPDNNPDVAAATALSAGNDQRASVVAQDYVDALDIFVPGLGDGAVAIPGQNGSTVWAGITAHCEANRRIGLLASPQGDTLSTLKGLAASQDSEYTGVFGPWIVVSDGGFGTRTISPEGFVAACRARAHNQIGPWRAPGGLMGKANTVLDVDINWTTEEANDLDSAKVNVIRKIANSIRLYGWRSLSTDEDNYSYLKDRDTLNRIVVDAEYKLEDYVFESIDSRGQLLSNVQTTLIGLVEPIRQAGGLYEFYDADRNLIDPGYKVETGSDINSQQSLANNEIRARLSVRVSPTGGLVSLTIVKVGVLSGL